MRTPQRARRSSSIKANAAQAAASGGVLSVDRGLSIIAAVADADMPIGLSEISRRTGLYKSTILRLVSSLESGGYIARSSLAQYSLGPMIWRLGLAYERSNPVRTHIEPILRQLVEDGTESASFHIRHSPQSRLCLLRVDSDHATLDRVKIGDVLPLIGAAGRILLGFENELKSARRERIAVSYGERDPACAGIACPVFGADDRLIGALSLSGPRERFTKKEVAAMRGLLLAAAERATAALSANSPAPFPTLGNSRNRRAKK